MKKTHNSFKYDTSSISNGEVFPNFKALFNAVTNGDPPTGAKNLDIAKTNLRRYLEWDLLCNQNSHEKSKRAVVILAVHNPPLPPQKDGKGTKGIYIHDLKPLLIQAAFENMPCDSKPSELFNQLGLFSKYFEELKTQEEVKKALERHDNPFDYNLWGYNHHLGKGKYNDTMSKKLKEIVTSALNSLQREGVIEWKEHYVVMPNIYDEQSKLKSLLQLKEEYKSCIAKLNEVASQKNAALNPTLTRVLLFGNGGYNEYRQIWEDCDLHYRAPASAVQMQAIENYQLFLRQCAYMKYRQSKVLPTENELPSIGNFFQNFALSKLYNDMRKKFAFELLGGTSFWKQIRVAIADESKAALYYDPKKPPENNSAASDRVSIKVLTYMEKQLDKQEIAPSENDTEDISLNIGPAVPGRVYSLRHSKSALALHTHLKGLYNLR